MKDRQSVTTNGRAAFYACMWDDFRQSAMNNGWALALHGSLASAMDIMAMPWTEDSSSCTKMIHDLTKCFSEPEKMYIDESEMPNNRTVFTIFIWPDFYLDINVMNLNEYSKHKLKK